MKMRRLGRTGIKVSEICLGTMTFGVQCDEPTSVKILDKAIDAGVSFIDTADVYPIPMSTETAGRTEEIIGRWLRRRGRRSDLIIATKCCGPLGPGPNDRGLSRKHILDAVEASLRRLQTDYIDLYQPHFSDPDTPPEETLSTLDSLVRQGKVRYLGCSNFAAWEVAIALGISDKMGWARYDCVQPRYNLIYRAIEDELLPLCRDLGLGVIAYNPLAGGLLTGKHTGSQEPATGTRFALGATGDLYRERYWHEAQFRAVHALQTFFAPRGKPLAQVALAWLLQQPGVTSAILGASKLGQLDETLPAVDVRLEQDELAACDQVWYQLPRRTGPAYRR